MRDVCLEDVTEGLKSSVERLFDLHGREEDLSPMLHFFTPDGSSTVALISGEIPKPELAATARKMSREMNCYAVAFIAEGWATPLGSTEKREILFVAIDARNGRLLIHWPILREGGRRRLGESSVYGMEAGATFSQLLDPSLKED